MTQLERSWSFWFGALGEQHGLVHGDESFKLQFSLRFLLTELSFWIAENDIDTWEQLWMAPNASTWPGAEKFDGAAIEEVEQLRKKRFVLVCVLVLHSCLCASGEAVAAARRQHGRFCNLWTVPSNALWSWMVCGQRGLLHQICLPRGQGRP
jgi:hypothetical protein